MKFIDLFAGLGGFHFALESKSLEMECVFACEKDEFLRTLYEEQFKMPCAGDIKQIHAEDIPPHDLLCAGFPCQPFSKAGKRRGLSDADRGNLIYDIERILQFHKPQYFLLENVANIKTHDGGQTWEKITAILEGCNYSIKDFILSPHQFGVPNFRQRIFIIGRYNGSVNIDIPDIKPFKENKAKDIKDYLKGINKKQSAEGIPDKVRECLETWQRYFIEKLPNDMPIPKFPIWAMEFGANYPLNGTAPYYMNPEELAEHTGAFGVSLKGMSRNEQLLHLPVYAQYEEKKFPQWKINYIQKNRDFWSENGSTLKEFVKKIEKYVNSWQKLEWNAGVDRGSIFNYILQFRSSGIRVKKTESVPSFVISPTQLPIIAWENRYLSLEEAQSLQGFQHFTSERTLEPHQRKKYISALGNAVNTKVVEEIAKQLWASESS